MVTDASSALQTISDTSPVRALQSVQSAAPTCHRGAAVLVFWGQELGGGAGLYWYWQRRGHLTLQLPCTARTLTDSHHQENCTLGLRQPLHEQATLKLQIANNKGEAGVHLLNSGSFQSSGTLFVCCCVLCMCDSAASCWSWQMAPAPSTSTYWPLHCSGTSHQPTSPVTLISALPDFWEETLSPSTI